MTKDQFKTRYRNHTKSFRLRKYETETRLSEHIWEIKNRGNDFSVKWFIIDRGKRYSPVSGLCQLCTTEKYYLIFKSELCSLNQRNEQGAHCRHKTCLLLGKTKTWKCSSRPWFLTLEFIVIPLHLLWFIWDRDCYQSSCNCWGLWSFSTWNRLQ